MNRPRCTPRDYIDFLVATPKAATATEAARVQPQRPDAPAHDSFTRLLNRLEPDPQTLWAETRPLIRPAEARGLGPQCVAFDSWYSGKENLKAIRDCGWTFLTQVRCNRKVNPDKAGNRPINECEIAATGTIVHLEGFGLVKAFRIATTDGGTEHWITTDLSMDEGTRLMFAERAWGIEEYHRGLKQHCGVDRCQTRMSKAQRNHIGLAIRAFVRLEWHRFTTGISWFAAKMALVREAVREYLTRPTYRLPQPATA